MSASTKCDALTLANTKCTRNACEGSLFCKQHHDFVLADQKDKIIRKFFISTRINEAKLKAIKDADEEWKTLDESTKKTWVVKMADYETAQSQKKIEQDSKPPTPSKAAKVKCCGVTKKGEPCKSWAKKEMTLCVTHA